MSCAMPLAICPSARSRSCCMIGLLALPQVVVGLLQRAVQLRLMRCQRHMLAQLAQELALGAAESLGGAARATSTPNTCFSTQQRRDDQ